jgi:hypothetical protein
LDEDELLGMSSLKTRIGKIVKWRDPLDPTAILTSLRQEGYLPESGVNSSPVAYNNKFVDIPETNRQIKIKCCKEYIKEYGGRLNGAGHMGEIIAFHDGITRNSMNACFIDANFELLWNAVLPFIPLEHFDRSNDYDNGLYESFEEYKKELKNDREMVTQSIRSFVWAIPGMNLSKAGSEFPAGNQGDCFELLLLFFSKLSDGFVSKVCNFPGRQFTRSYMCSANPNHCYARIEGFPSLFELRDDMRTAISAEKTFASEEELDKEFSSVFLFKHVLRQRMFKCDMDHQCDGTVTGQNIIDPHGDFPPFLFINDPTNNLKIQKE